jgi:FkbM family methyltransferase
LIPLKIFIDDSITKLKHVRNGTTLIAKFILFWLAILSQTPGFLRARFRFLDEKLARLNRFLAKNAIVKVDGVYFRLLDEESFITVFPEFEKFIDSYLKVKEGDVFLDVGAHIGKYTLSVASIMGKKGQVISIEPYPETYRVLLENIRLNSFENIQTFRIAAWSQNCKKQLFLSNNAGGHSLTPNKKPDERWPDQQPFIIIQAKPLDDILEKIGRKVDWIKIDVEGAEIEVLQGMRKTLEHDKPNLIIEARKTNLEKIKKFMEQQRYHVERIPASEKDTYYYIYCTSEFLDKHFYQKIKLEEVKK